MLVVGLTGGIGSGKTAASDYFASLGITVVDADVVAREVVEPHQPAWQAISERYGKQAFLCDQSLDRAWLRAKVFGDPNERIWLEQQTHPRIRERLIQQLQNSKSAYAILVSPLLFESGQSALAQRTLLVDVPTDIQVTRASSRDGNDEEQILRIIAAQMSREDRRAKATDIVDNSTDLGSLYQQLLPLHQYYLELANAS
ncbi:dephospho-CoA kinase [Thalassolituus oleivorans]|uniref:dephospho-CoA kinase n=1 Tax=Thalassolituus oleivorans TaxID=187493 RepID=UPI0023F3830C|nr:dephospho-CoA kinase [Thalassolituus oleivorans]